MKIFAFFILMAIAAFASPMAACAEAPEPTVYVIKKGDTLWGLSQQFMKDPYYWPNLWAKNPDVGNPHFIFPGQQIRFQGDRIEVVRVMPPPSASPSPAPETTPSQVAAPQASAEKTEEQPVAERMFPVQSGNAFLMEKDTARVGSVVSTYQNRRAVATDDFVYVDIGKDHGGNAGDRFAVFKNSGSIRHPVSGNTIATKIVPLGIVQLVETEDKVSRARIIKSYYEIDADAFLLPYREPRREVALKAPTRDMDGHVLDTQTGNHIIGAGDVVFIDVGAFHGLQTGNMLYITRDVIIDTQYMFKFKKVPREVLGALVVVDAGEKASTAVVVKSVDTIYIGDRVETKREK